MEKHCPVCCNCGQLMVSTICRHFLPPVRGMQPIDSYGFPSIMVITSPSRNLLSAINQAWGGEWAGQQSIGPLSVQFI